MSRSVVYLWLLICLKRLWGAKWLSCLLELCEVNITSGTFTFEIQHASECFHNFSYCSVMEYTNIWNSRRIKGIIKFSTFHHSYWSCSYLFRYINNFHLTAILLYTHLICTTKDVVFWHFIQRKFFFVFNNLIYWTRSRSS